VAFAERVRRWTGKVIGMTDQIANLEVAASLGSKVAQRRLRAIEADASQPGVVRSAAQKSWHRARNMAYIYGMGASDDDVAD